jgi:hypothetical protein
VKSGRLKAVLIGLSFAIVALPFVVVYGASGRIEGKGADPRVAVVAKLQKLSSLGKGWVKVGAAWMTGNTSVDLTGVKLPQAANRAAICALDDILALSIQNSK